MRIEEKTHFIGGVGYWVKNIQVGKSSDQPTLIFLHDALGCAATWKDFPEQLCQKMQLDGIVYDRQGHGRSDAFDKTRPLDYLEREAWDALPKLLNYFRINKKILIGHSDGASISLLYESRFCEAEAVVSMAGHVKVEPITLVGIQAAVHEFEQAFIFEKLKRYHGEKTRKLVDDWANTWLSKEFRSWNIIKHLPNIKCATLAIQGAADEYATESHLWEISTQIGLNAKPVLLENCGHFPHKEKPEKVIEIIADFLKPII
jgi:pimeloyl-ACP methyl ester carboxylesterase